MEFINDYVNKLVEQQSKDLDNMCCEFLEENGYKIDKPYNIEQLKEIRDNLASQNKVLDWLAYTEFSKDCTQAYHYMIPFFNSICNPLTKETRNEIIEKWKEKNRKDK